MIHNLLKDYEVILASNSPRRKEIFSFFGVNPIIIPSHAKEDFSITDPIEFVRFNSKIKTLDSANKFFSSFVIGADTIVVIDEQILGKPKNDTQARDYLQKLSGKSHFVYTGITIAHEGRYLFDYEKTEVFFQKLSTKEIDEYIITGEPSDKAGAYGIQGFGSQFINKIEGCYFNVMGFPINKFYQMIKQCVI